MLKKLKEKAKTFEASTISELEKKEDKDYLEDNNKFWLDKIQEKSK